MSKEKKSLVFFGNERLATGVSSTTPILKSLVNAGYRPSLIVVSNSTSSSRTSRKLEVEEFANEHQIPVLNTNNNDEILEQIYNVGASFAVLAAYGRMVPQSILDAFSDGIINIHPSLLPKHRGPTPIESVILNGETTTGVSIMKLVKAMDAGPVYLQQEVTLSGTESKQELCDKLSEIGASLLAENLEKILSGEIKSQEQNNSEATYDKLINKEDGEIDWSKSAESLEREVRAYAHWPKSRTTFGSVEVVITKAYAETSNNSELKPGEIVTTSNKLIVQTSEGQLYIEKLKPAGKQEMDSVGFLAGYKDRIF